MFNMVVMTMGEKVAAVRDFNRFFTRRIGVLREGLLHTPYSLTEARIIFEIARGKGVTASGLCSELGLDAGYLSRILARMEQDGLVERVKAENDGRQRLLRLTERGEGAFGVLNRRSEEEIAEFLQDLSEGEQARLFQALETVRQIFQKDFKYAAPFFLRQHESGDMGWVTHRHGVLYEREYGWDARFEALVAQIVSDFINNFQPTRERCWIAEMEGEIVGSIFLVQESEEVAKLRLLLVEPRARGLGLGTRLVEECIRFASERGYKQINLWTQSNLLAARRIYAKCGFQCTTQYANPQFGHDLTSEIWSIAL
jgi:DNA-binding MarR family transcriptional regulator/N-acetylglutamate synthase-like GNAT family acetyltransferase